jgi:hypothetical protein
MKSKPEMFEEIPIDEEMLAEIMRDKTLILTTESKKSTVKTMIRKTQKSKTFSKT